MSPPPRTRATRLLPASLASALDQARRDVAMVLGALSGRRPPVLVPRPPRPVAPAPLREEPARPAEPPRGTESEAAPSGAHPVTYLLRGAPQRVRVSPGQTVLEAGLAAGLDLPHSCTLGGCGTCMVTLREGEVRMEEPHCLSAEERARGQVLMCVSRPVSPVTVEVP